jgi:hypothetical protein
MTRILGSSEKFSAPSNKCYDLHMTADRLRPLGFAQGDSADVSPRPSPWLPKILLLCILPLCFLGYGTDNDSYGVVAMGVQTWHAHIPGTSRNPGYWIYEAIIYVLSTLGGSLLCNLGSYLMAVLVAWRFWKWGLRLRVPQLRLLTASLVASPGFIIAASSTDDYLWSLLFIVLGAESILTDRLVSATLLSALAMGIRGGNGPVVAGGFAAAILYELCTQRRATVKAAKLATAGVVSALLAACAFYPSYVLAGRTMNFTAAMAGPPEMYTPLLRVGKFFYKGSVAFGPFALLVIAIATFLYFRQHRTLRDLGPRSSDNVRLAVLCLGYLIGNLVLFMRYPIEFFYLIPATFFFLLLAGITIFAYSRPLTVALLVAILSFDFVWPIFVRPNVPGRSTGARLHFGVAPGIVVGDIRDRRKVMHCHDYECFVENSR